MAGEFQICAPQNQEEDWGNRLLEVFQVVIHSESPTDLYGTNEVDDGYRTHHIYDRGVDNCERILPNNCATLTLTGPHVPLIAYDCLIISLRLRDKVTGTKMNGKIYYDGNFYSSYPYFDKPLAKKIARKNISATLNYVLMNKAWVARVEVTLLDMNKNRGSVYGSLSASCSAFSEIPLDTTTTLFNNSRKKQIEQEQGQVINLVRSIVHVPLHSILKVTADLMLLQDTSADQEIAKGFAEFPVQMFSTTAEIIGGIKVQVAFTPS